MLRGEGVREERRDKGDLRGRSRDSVWGLLSTGDGKRGLRVGKGGCWNRDTLMLQEGSNCIGEAIFCSSSRSNFSFFLFVL